LVQTDEQRKAKKKEYDSRSEVKAKKKTREATPEYKAKKKSNELKLEVIERRKETAKKYRQTEEYKVKRKERRSRPEEKKKSKEYSQREEVKARRKEQREKPEVKAKLKEYGQRPEVKARAKALKQTPESKAKIKASEAKIRLKILLHYSKSLSNSNVPCCACCGEDFHVDFLALDHIAGRRQMDSETELKKLGYSSEFHHNTLARWIIKNNFPEGFQILCQNCNFAKGMKGNNNTCPHETKRLEETFAMMEEQSSFEV
jgi:hypothetical protein